MIKPDQLPDEVVLAARDVFIRSQDHISENIRAAIAAALNSWPEVERIYRSEDEKLFTILLPLPQKDGDK